MRYVILALLAIAFRIQDAGPQASEMRILEAERKADLAVFRELLAEQFIEIGPDGARYDKAAVLRIIASHPPQVVTASDFAVIPAGRDAAVVNYVVESTLPDGSHRRHTASSVWARQGSGWILVFHQGTVMPTGAGNHPHGGAP
jgi:hypothetical protein